MEIHCSHYFPASRESGKAERASPTVVYLHGNSGCRLEGDAIADRYLRRGMAFFSVDFGGCGNSDGGLVTLGFREREDLEVVLDYLKSHTGVSFVCVYGRSMGAATALLVAADDRYYHNIAGLVIDSCYVSVREVALDVARKYSRHFPLFPTESSASMAVDALREAVVAKAGFDIDSIDVLRAAPLCQAPALFGHALDDSLVSTSHTQRVFDAYGRLYDGVRKDISIFAGDHNSIRSDDWTERTCEFLEACFQMAEMESAEHGLARRLMLRVRNCVPWRGTGSFHESRFSRPVEDGKDTLKKRRNSEPSCSLWVSLLNPSPRAKPVPVGDDENYVSWLMQRKYRPGSLTRSLSRIEGPNVSPPAHSSPVGDFISAVFGANEVRNDRVCRPMSPRLPPRHEAHANVYKSPSFERSLNAVVAGLQQGGEGKCMYCEVEGQILQVQLPGPWHRPICRRWQAAVPELHSQGMADKSTPAKRSTLADAPVLRPPRGPGKCASRDGSSSDETGEVSREILEWVVSDSERQGTSVCFMLLLLFFISWVTYQNRFGLDSMYKYR